MIMGYFFRWARSEVKVLASALRFGFMIEGSVSSI